MALGLGCTVVGGGSSLPSIKWMLVDKLDSSGATKHYWMPSGASGILDYSKDITFYCAANAYRTGTAIEIRQVTLNDSTGGSTVIYPEVISPSFITYIGSSSEVACARFTIPAGSYTSTSSGKMAGLHVSNVGYIIIFVPN